MIREEAERMGLIKDNEHWPEHLDNEMIYSKDDPVLRKSCSKDVIVSHLKHTLSLQNKLIEKEAKKRGKYGQAIDVMFKKYQSMAAESRDELNQLATQRADRQIEKEIFTTL